MDILQLKQPLFYEEEIKYLYNVYKYKDVRLELKGTGALTSQLYPSDYDFYSKLSRKNLKDFTEWIKTKIEDIKSDINLYFMELKVEYKDNTKHKFFKNEVINIQNIKDIKIVKLDIILWNNKTFIDTSCIYDFETKKPNYKKQLTEDIKEFFKEGKYFKVLKRLFSLYRINKNEIKLNELSEIFNSKYGLMYKIINNIETIEKVKKIYNDRLTRERLKINKEFYKIKSIKSTFENYNKQINETALNEIPRFMPKKLKRELIYG
jgi:hypothetical protein